MYEHYQELLDKKGLKNADVARAADVSNMTLSDWKRGKTTPKTDTMQKIANYLGTTVEYLLTGEEKSPNEFSVVQGTLDVKISQDLELKNALENYFKLSEKKKKLVIELINSLAE